MRINIDISLKLTRLSIYCGVLALTSLTVLLPWSVITYLRFYSALIPRSFLSQPITFDYSRHNRGPFAAVSLYDILSPLVDAYKEDGLAKTRLNQSPAADLFEVSLRYAYSGLGETPELTGLRTSLVDQSLVRNEVVGSSEWPVVTSQNTCFGCNANNVISWPMPRSVATEPYNYRRIVTFDSQAPVFNGLYYTAVKWFRFHSTTDLLPNWALSYIIPPFLRSWFSWQRGNLDTLVQIRVPNLGMENAQSVLTNSRETLLVLEFASPHIYLDSAVLEFSVQFSGFKYHLHRHPVLFLVLGVSLFWTVSTLTCLVLAWGLFLIWSKMHESSQSEKDSQLAVQRVYSQRSEEVMTNLQTVLG